MSARFFAAIAPSRVHPRVPHYIGLPPELGSTDGDRQMLPWPQILLLEEHPDGVFLCRYTSDGAYAGDTWHLNVAQAQAQAAYEYADLLGAWQAIPANVEAALTFALQNAEANGHA